MSAETLELLAGSPFFEGFDPQDLAELASHARMIAFQATERVFAEGDPATAFFLLVSGAVGLSFAAEVGKEHPSLAVQTIAHAGHPIGWSAMVEPYVYRATATARTSTATSGSTTGSAMSTPTPATSTPMTKTPAAPRRRAASSSWTRPAPACGWARTWSSARKAPAPRPRNRRAPSGRVPSDSPPTSAPSR